MPTQVSWWKSIFQPKHQYSRFLILSNASHSSILLSEPFPHLSASSVNFHWKEDQNRKEYTFAPPSICQGILKTCTNLEIFLYLFLIIILIYTWQSLSVRVDSTVVPLFTKSSRQQDPKNYILWCWDEGPCLISAWNSLEHKRTSNKCNNLLICIMIERSFGTNCFAPCLMHNSMLHQTI